MPVPTLPSALADGTLALGSDVRANDDAIVAALDHALDRDNFPASGANIPATVLSTTAGERVPTNRIEDDAVTADKLKDDPTAGAAAAAVATAAHVKDGILNGKKLTLSTVGSDRLRITYHEWDPVETQINSMSAVTISTGLTQANTIPLGCYFVIPGAPGVTAAFTLSVHLNTGTNVWNLTMFNPTAVAIGISGIKARMVYISVAST